MDELDRPAEEEEEEEEEERIKRRKFGQLQHNTCVTIAWIPRRRGGKKTYVDVPFLFSTISTT
jgi:hypothetical protein